MFYHLQLYIWTYLSSYRTNCFFIMSAVFRIWKHKIHTYALYKHLFMYRYVCRYLRKFYIHKWIWTTGSRLCVPASRKKDVYAQSDGKISTFTCTGYLSTLAVKKQYFLQIFRTLNISGNTFDSSDKLGTI
jgi:hypothetical protein